MDPQAKEASRRLEPWPSCGVFPDLFQRLLQRSHGIPVATLELKTDNTQTVRDAIKQYKVDRKSIKNRPLLKPGRALVHFNRSIR